MIILHVTNSELSPYCSLKCLSKSQHAVRFWFVQDYTESIYKKDSQKIIDKTIQLILDKGFEPDGGQTRRMTARYFLKDNDIFVTPDNVFDYLKIVTGYSKEDFSRPPLL
eukprot:SAG22_NODE_965_length_6268_cov_30.435403_3_plen_110_part_00